MCTTRKELQVPIQPKYHRRGQNETHTERKVPLLRRKRISSRCVTLLFPEYKWLGNACGELCVKKGECIGHTPMIPCVIASSRKNPHTI